MRIKTKTLIKLDLKCFCVLGIAILLSLLALYVYQINAETSERYSVHNYQNKISELSKENKELEINSAQAGSLASISGAIEGLDFEKTDRIEYIQVMDAQVVIK